MTDALSVLRDFIRTKKPVVIDGDDIVLGDLRYPKNTETSFHANKGKDNPYTLEAIWFMLQNVDTRQGEYLLKATSQNIARVALVDKKDIFNILFGKTDVTAADVPQTVVAEGSSSASSVAPMEISAPDGSSSTASVLAGAASLKHDLAHDEASTSEQQQKKKARLDEEGVELQRDEATDKHHQQLTESQQQQQQQHESQQLQDLRNPETQLIVDRERQLRTRTSVLRTNKKNFQTIFESVRDLVRKEEEKKKVEQQKEAEKQRKTVSYDRYNITEDSFWKDRLKETAEFQINTRGTFSGLQPGKLAEQAAAVQTAKPNKKPPSSSSSSSSSSKPSSSSSNPSSSSQRQHAKPTQQPSHKPKNIVPIIILSGGYSNLLTLYNVLDFLEGSNFVLTTDKKNAPGAKAPGSSVSITPKHSKLSIPNIQVIDNISRLDSKDWSRVVAVFVTDQTWQFKGWKWQTPPEIFSHVRGFYVCYDDNIIPPVIKSWDVKVLQISKHKRHLDATAALEFWNTLDDFITKKKPYIAS